MNTMKKLLAILLCVLTAASLTACGSKKTAASSSAAGSSAAEQIANPFVECATMQEAAKIAGFEMTVPETVEGFADPAIEAVKEDMIQVSFAKGDDELLLRKALGTDDVSGDYNTYAETNTLTVGDLTVTAKGSDGVVHVATWTSGDYTFAIDASGAGISEDLVSSLVQSVN